MFLPEQTCRSFSFADIQSATNNFDDALIVGEGGFGKVYKGVIGPVTVAIKRLNPLSKQGRAEFGTEIELLSKFRHCHIVSLIGYCDDSDEMVIVYEYMVHGTLADHLHRKIGNSSSLSWVQRLKICIGAARGLEYLHTGTGVLQRVIHRDVKTSNILLDENWAARVSDFGLSKVGPTTQDHTDVSTMVKGTVGYLDPEYYLTRRLTRKSDVYSFGVVLLEGLSGRPALDPRLQWEERNLARWGQRCIKDKKVYQIIDPSLNWEILPNSLTTFVELADQCLHQYPKKRPTMSEVVTQLELALAVQERRDSSIILDDAALLGNAIHVAAEWNETYQTGVYITLKALQDGTKEIKRLRFSKRRWLKQQAEIWWLENRIKVYERYGITTPVHWRYPEEIP